jgi:transcriptional regulator with XRE-family HTH domain
MSDKTYKDFAEAFYQLKKKNYDISYGRIAQKTGILEATVNALANRRRANPPEDDIMAKIADCFNLTPDYFYEWRLKRFLEFLDENREFLDTCIKMARGYNAKAKKEFEAESQKKEIESSEKESKDFKTA